MPLNLSDSLLISMEALFTRICEISFIDSKSKLIFIVNQYDWIVNTMGENGIQGGEEFAFYHELLQMQTVKFVEEELRQHWSYLVTFVMQQNEMLQSKQQQQQKQLEAKVEAIIKEFSGQYAKKIREMHSEILSSFGNLKTSSIIFKQVVAQLTLYYSRFEDFAKKNFSHISSQLISLGALKSELQTYFEISIF